MPDMSKMKDMAGKMPDMSKMTEMAGKMPDMSKMTGMAGKIPGMPDMSKVTEMAKKMPTIPKMPMVGGGETDSGAILGPILVLTIGFVVVSGIVVSLRRSRQNAKTTAASQQSRDQETDEPPLPGNLRNHTPAT
jgi:hypothetical protein